MLIKSIQNFLTWAVSCGAALFLGFVTYANTQLLLQAKAQGATFGFALYAQLYLPFVLYVAIFIYTLLEYRKTKETQILTLAPLALLTYIGILNIYGLIQGTIQ